LSPPGTGSLRVMVDARAAVAPYATGVGRYADRIVRHLPAADANSAFTAWYLHGDAPGRKRARFAGVDGLAERVSPVAGRVFDAVSSRTGVPRLEWLVGTFDAVLATNFLPPATVRPAVVVVHDLAFELVPETAPHVGARWRRRFENWLGRAARVIVPSESAREDLVRAHGPDPSRIDTIPHGVDAAIPVADADIQKARHRFGVGDVPYVLFVGGMEPRKNIDTLVRAFARIGDPRVHLVLLGGRVPWVPEWWDTIGLELDRLAGSVRERIVRTGFVADGDRRALLAGAAVLANPSRYEGFGFPVLEGFAAGVPVLTSTTSSLPEVAGDAVLLADPDDEQAIADGIGRLLADDDLRTRLVAGGHERVARFTWDRCAAATARTLRRAAHE
jgi:glycosyltransferase involved in cell wall biosynthesis